MLSIVDTVKILYIDCKVTMTDCSSHYKETFTFTVAWVISWLYHNLSLKFREDHYHTKVYSE